MIDQTEVNMAASVQSTRAILRDLLTKEELVTRRTPGSTPPHTFEDTAKEIARGPTARAWQVGLALANFQEAVNALWVYAGELKISEIITKKWLIRHNRPHLSTRGFTFDDAVSEATFALRHAVIRFDPTRGTRLITYAGYGMFSALNLWWARLAAPVEIPQKLALSSEGPRRAMLQEYTNMWDNDPEEESCESS